MWNIFYGSLKKLHLEGSSRSCVPSQAHPRELSPFLGTLTIAISMGSQKETVSFPFCLSNH